MRIDIVFVAALTLALGFASPAAAGCCHSKPTPKTGPKGQGGNAGGGGQAAPVSVGQYQHTEILEHQLERLHMDGREIPGAHQMSNADADKIPEFSGDWIGSGVAQNLIWLADNPTAGPGTRQQYEQAVLAQGISVFPTGEQLADLRALVATAGQPGQIHQAFPHSLIEYTQENELSRGFWNFTIDRRQPTSIYGWVNAEEMKTDFEIYGAMMDANGPVDQGKNRYVPAPHDLVG